MSNSQTVDIRPEVQPSQGVADVGRYRVFLSYSHADTKWARWLMRRLENYPVPHRFHGRSAPIGEVGRRIAPVFRDRDELPTASDLGEIIREALRQSATQVVICSPAAARSRWVNEEILQFKRLHGEARVFAFIVSGEPKVENAADDCFPPALRLRTGVDGELSPAAAEVVAADSRPQGDGKGIAFLRLVAGLLGVGFDELRQRELQRRNRRLTWIAAGAIVGMAITVGLAAVAWQARNDAQRAEHIAALEAARANGEAAIAKAVNDFLMVDLLRQADSTAQADAKFAPNPDLKLREALNRAGEKVGNRFEHQPLTEAAVRYAIGTAYYGVGDFAQAAHHLGRALELQQRLLGPEHPTMFTTMNRLAITHRSQGKYIEAAALHAQILEIRKRVLGAEHPETLLSMGNLAAAYSSQAKYAEAAALEAQTLEIRKRVLGPEHPQTLTSMGNLAAVHRSQGKFAEAAALDAQTLEIRQRVLGPEHPHTLTSMGNLAAVYSSQAKYAEAAALYAQTFEIRQRVLGSEHPHTLASMAHLTDAYRSQGKFAEAAALHAQTVEIRQRVLGPEHPDTLTSMGNLAQAYKSQGKYTEAAALNAQTLEICRRVLGPEHPKTLAVMNNLATDYDSQGKFAEASVLHSQTSAILTRVLGPEHPNTLISKNSLALAYAFQGKFAEAEHSLRETLVIREKKFPDEWRTFYNRNLLGGALAGQGRFPEAEPLLISGFEGMEQRESKIPAPNKIRLKEALERLERAYTEWGRPEKAAVWQLKLDEHNRAHAKKSTGKAAAK